MAHQRLDQVTDFQDQLKTSPPEKSRVRWTIWDLIVLTSVIAISLGLPIPAIAIAITVAVFALTVFLPVLLVYLPVLRNRKRLNSDNIFIELITKAILLALITIALSSLALWIKVQTSNDPNQSWAQVIEAIQRIP